LYAPKGGKVHDVKSVAQSGWVTALHHSRPEVRKQRIKAGISRTSISKDRVLIYQCFLRVVHERDGRCRQHSSEQQHDNPIAGNSTRRMGTLRLNTIIAYYVKYSVLGTTSASHCEQNRLTQLANLHCTCTAVLQPHTPTHVACQEQPHLYNTTSRQQIHSNEEASSLAGKWTNFGTADDHLMISD
jgi:hypothetical protein